MVYRLIYTKTAEKDLDRIDKKQAIKILLKVDGFLKLHDPMVKAKKLHIERRFIKRFENLAPAGGWIAN